MTETATPHDIERFRDAIRGHLGLQFDENKFGFLAEVLQRRSERLGRHSKEYLYALANGVGRDEIAALAEDLTVTETYFFRNIEQFHALREIVLPERMRLRGASRSLRFLSAACASGEEAFTLAIVARETIADPSWSVSIRAVDINPAVLAKAKRAHYAPWALRETPQDTQHRWFSKDDRALVLDASIRDAVTFEAKNLAADDAELWIPETYDVVFCRNAMMYFSPAHASNLVARIAQALAPGGYLFLGHAETLRGLSDDFHLRHTHGTFYYQRKDGLASSRPQPIVISTTAPSISPVAGAAAVFTGEWVDTIHQANERIGALVATHDRPVQRVALRQTAWDMAEVFDLVRGERFSEALARVRGLPREAEEDADVLLVKAMLFVHAGDFAQARATCDRLAAADELNAGAHYILALCCEGLGDRAMALEHDRIAIYLDAAFAMPRLHAGLLTKRNGDRDGARKELTQALALIEHEEPSRLLLFGGGFNRQALIALCSSALRDCGGRL